VQPWSCLNGGLWDRDEWPSPLSAGDGCRARLRCLPAAALVAPSDSLTLFVRPSPVIPDPDGSSPVVCALLLAGSVSGKSASDGREVSSDAGVEDTRLTPSDDDATPLTLLWLASVILNRASTPSTPNIYMGRLVPSERLPAPQTTGHSHVSGR